MAPVGPYDEAAAPWRFWVPFFAAARGRNTPRHNGDRIAPRNLRSAVPRRGGFRPTRTWSRSTATPVISANGSRMSSARKRTWVAQAGSWTSTSRVPCSSRTGRTWAGERHRPLPPNGRTRRRPRPNPAPAQRAQQAVQRVGEGHRIVTHRGIRRFLGEGKGPGHVSSARRGSSVRQSRAADPHSPPVATGRSRARHARRRSRRRSPAGSGRARPPAARRGRGDHDLPGGRLASRAVARPGSSSDSTSSSTSTGVDPVRSAPAVRGQAHARASVRCSPCEAWVRAGIPAMDNASSSRWGPTVETPRRTSASRAAASAAARPVRRHAGSYVNDTGVGAGELGVGLRDHRREARRRAWPGRDRSWSPTSASGRPTRRAWPPPPRRAGRRPASATCCVDARCGRARGARVVLRCKRNERVVEEPPPIGRRHP